MIHACRLLFFTLLLAEVLAGICLADQAPRFGPFGAVRLAGNATAAAHVAILLSGPTGWGPAEDDAARVLVRLDALVIGVDTPAYLRAAEREPGCPNSSYELEILNKSVQKALGRPQLTTPALVGLGPGAGATLVYANLVQAPPGAFRGGISVDFSPELALRIPLCQGKGLHWDMLDGGRTVRYLPTRAFPLRWTALQPADNAAHPPAWVQAFAAGIPETRVMALPAAGRVPGRRPFVQALGWAFADLVAGESRPTAAAPDPNLADLPLVEIRAEGQATDTLAVFVSGDGGWAGLDQDMAGVLAAAGVDVVGVNSLRYFWVRKTPEDLGRDLARILDRYARLWNKTRFLLIGYSLGADALPFMAARLPARLLDRVRLVALLSPGHATDLEFQVGDWLADEAEAGLPIRPEVGRLPGDRVACFFGAEEEDALCPDLDPAEARLVRMPGSHHFDGDYEGLAERVLEAAGLPAGERP